ncbi:MAG: hypothetical protein JSV34_02790 [Candidatus Omnitrophota bacterium]|nr:MAG: hypothetical protein JSV34_02790 [Candidatus Omnitrophota bacterium]
MIRRYLRFKEEEWENLCIRCGGCCGAFDDPCLHLKKNKSGKYYCEIYRKRLGLRKTVKGEEFDCVPVKEIIRTYWKKDYLCTCKKELRSKR